jgi:uncharacterized protein
LAITLALLVGVNLLTAFAPTVVIVAAGPLIAAALVGLAHWVGLTWHDLGLSRRTWRRGAAYGGVAVALVAAVYLVGILLPPTRQAFLDVRYDIALGSALLTALVFIPLKTVLVEEIAFRGVLLGMLRHRLGMAGAIGISSLLFGLWHITPSLRIGDQNQALDAVTGPGLGSQLLVIAGVVAFTTVAGALFCELRRRSGSVLAHVGMHWAVNGLGVLLSSLLWTNSFR